jgi:hypothetical protein
MGRRQLLKETAFARPKKPVIDPKFSKAAKGAYGGEDVPEGYELAHKTETLKFYRNKVNPKDVVLGVRGTADKRDIAADAALSFGLLKYSKRYRQDKAAMADFLKRHPEAEIQTAGHSLGGAVARQLTRDFQKNVKGGVGYNSAIGLNELLSPSKLREGKQTRYTTKTDPLRLLSKPFLRAQDQAQVINSKGTANLLAAHKMSNFDATGAGV